MVSKPGWSLLITFKSIIYFLSMRQSCFQLLQVWLVHSWKYKHMLSNRLFNIIEESGIVYNIYQVTIQKHQDPKSEFCWKNCSSAVTRRQSSPIEHLNIKLTCSYNKHESMRTWWPNDNDLSLYCNGSHLCWAVLPPNPHHFFLTPFLPCLFSNMITDTLTVPCPFTLSFNEVVSWVLHLSVLLTWEAH